MKITTIIQTLCISILVFCTNAFADGFIIVPRPAAGGYHYPLAVTYHRVTVTIDNGMCLTEIDQEFYNPGNSTEEGIYLFPVPRGAVIKKFSMFINGAEKQAETLDADKARGIYENIVRQMRDPALMEYAGQDLFRTRIYPIEAHSSKRVKISYQEPVKSDDGISVYTYPLNTEKFSSAPLGEVSVSMTIVSRNGVINVLCPGYTVDVVRKNENETRLSYEDKNVKPDRDFRVFYSAGNNPLAISLIGRSDGSGGGHFLLSVSPGADTYGDKPVEKDVVFVVDTSGSMTGGKLDQAKRALRECISKLNRGDRFQIVRFSTEAEAVFPDLTEAATASTARAAAFIEGIQAAGGTNIHDALRLALSGSAGTRPRYVIFITDGKPTIGETDEYKLVNQVKTHSATRRIFTFGIGTDLNTHLLEGLAAESGGSARYITEGENISSTITAFFRKIQSPALTSLTLSFNGQAHFTDMQPSVLPDIFRGDTATVYGKYSTSGPVTVTISGNVMGEKKTYTGSFVLGSGDQGGDFIPRMWARKKIAMLMEKIRLRGDDRAAVDEIVSLARAYGIVTPYTSYLILEDETTPSPAGIPESRNRTLSAAPEEALDSIKKQSSGAGAIRAKEGRSSVDAAREIDELKDDRIDHESARQGKSGRSVYASKTVRFIDGRAFYFTSWGWIDGRLADRKVTSSRKVRFLSDEYFKLGKTVPGASSVLSLGSRIRFLIGDIMYEITE